MPSNVVVIPGTSQMGKDLSVQRFVLTVLAEHNISGALNSLLPIIRAYPNLASEHSWVEVLTPLRRRAPKGMEAYDTLLERYPLLIDKMFLALFARILWEGVMCRDHDIAEWAATFQMRTENWEQTGWRAFVKCWAAAGLKLRSQDMNEWDKDLGWAIWSMKRCGVFGEDCMDRDGESM
ncbi:hypothetical protein FRC10_005466 [Ceratobasidium sp. 414]|nr:hypothetical protein FRC10_005466 [Ceratobasidium sp. 414]